MGKRKRERRRREREKRILSREREKEEDGKGAEERGGWVEKRKAGRDSYISALAKLTKHKTEIIGKNTELTAPRLR